MVKDFLNNDDSNSTQLEGKKLKKRGVVIDGELIEIDNESPSTTKGQGKKEARQYFTDREYGEGESEEDREERLKKERAAARKQQQEELIKQQQQQKKELEKEPNNVLDKIEQGVMMSQNEGKPLNEMEFKRDGVAVSREKAHERERPTERSNDLAGAYLAVGDNIKNMDFKNQIAPDLVEQQKYSLQSIPATQVQDIRTAAQKEKGGVEA